MVIKEKCPAALAIKGMLAYANFLCTDITAVADCVDKAICLICLFTVFTGSFSKDF